MAELADAQRSGRCLVYPSTGSTPASGIEVIEMISHHPKGVLDGMSKAPFWDKQQ